MRSLAPLALAALAAAAPAEAAVPLTLGLRVGYGWPAGTAFEDPATGVRESMTDQLSSQVPIQLDLAWRVRPRLAVGMYASYAFDDVGGAVETTCATERLSCTAHTFRLGVEATWRGPSLENLSPRLFPWVGLGVGWEWTSFEQSIPGVRYRASYDGVEFLGFQLGAEYAVNDRVALGPYALVSVGTYTGLEQTATGYGTESLPVARTVHAWMSVGVRGRYSW